MIRSAVRSQLRIASFLMCGGGTRCANVAAQLGVGRSTVNNAVKQVSQCICQIFRDKISFQACDKDLRQIMSAFHDISGLRLCIGAVNVTHFQWLRCPQNQYYEYRWYKGYINIGIFAICSANRNVTVVDIGHRRVTGDESIFQRTTLLKNVETGPGLGSNCHSLLFEGASTRPYLIGNSAFNLQL